MKETSATFLEVENIAFLSESIIRSGDALSSRIFERAAHELIQRRHHRAVRIDLVLGK
jgi:hypothetical protein